MTAVMKHEINESGIPDPIRGRLTPGYDNRVQKRGAIWSAIGATVKGASHLRSGKPNQDAMGWDPVQGKGTQLILAIADGHGSEKSFRSQHGSREAVDVVITKLRDAVSCMAEDTPLSTMKHHFESRLPVLLVQEWSERILDHLAAHPFTEDELTLLREKDGDSACEAVLKKPLLAYGSTMLAVVVNDRYCCCLQLGDGDIVLVSANGDAERPLPKDDRLIANETTSLCLREAANDFRVSFQALAGMPPALLVLSTDGYSNSFQHEDGFLKAGSDFLAILRESGPMVIKEQLSVWLDETSRMGSGDDVTVLIAYRQDTILETLSA